MITRTRVVLGLGALFCLLGVATQVGLAQPRIIRNHGCKISNETGSDIKIAIAGYRAANAWTLRKGESRTVILSDGEKIVGAFDVAKELVLGAPLKLTVKEPVLLVFKADGITTSVIAPKEAGPMPKVVPSEKKDKEKKVEVD